MYIYVYTYRYIVISFVHSFLPQSRGVKVSSLHSARVRVYYDPDGVSHLPSFATCDKMAATGIQDKEYCHSSCGSALRDELGRK